MVGRLNTKLIDSYIICATARSGSNWLCELLASLGFAGRPWEHFWDPEGTEPEPLDTRWPRVLATGTGPNGVFGVKLMYYQAERLEDELPALLDMPGRPLAEVLNVAMNGPKYIYLTRQDHTRQAISFVRAKQTRRWRSMDVSAGAPLYDSAAIEDAIGFIEYEECMWSDFFQRNNISPNCLTYEVLDADPAVSIGKLLAHLGHSAPDSISLPPTQHRKQADEETETWLRRYQQDAHRDEPFRSGGKS